METESEARARIDAWLTTMGAASITVGADQTLRAPEGWTERSTREGGSLPRISLGQRGASEGPQVPTATPGAGDFSILSTLGEGGQGRVHLAWQGSLRREVAIKTVKPDAADRAAVALFEEARVTGSLEHPGVIPVHALGVDERGGPVLVMKRVEGVDWETLLREPEHPSWRARIASSGGRLAANLEIFARLCEPLALAHSRGILHRDIKPENVMLGEYGEVYLVDWGLAVRAEAERARDPSAPAAIVGTPAFMAPEMVTGEVVDERTDVYLLGATLHYVLTGQHRHEGRVLTAVLYAALSSEPFAYEPDVPSALADLANRATARDPALRPPSSRAFREELLEYLRRRSADALCLTAEARLGDLRAALRAAGGGPPADLAAAYRVGTEARFGFAQCLREQPGFERATEGLAGAIEALVELELCQGQAESAAALLRELDRADEDPSGRPDGADGAPPGRAGPRFGAPYSDLEARVSAAQLARARSRRENEALRAMARELDPAAGARARSAALLALGVLVAGVGIWATTGSPSGVTTPMLVQLDAVILAAALVLVVIFRRATFATMFNRRVVGLLLVALTSSLVNRILGAMDDVEVPPVLEQDALIFLCVLAVGGVTVVKGLWFAAALSAGMLLAMRLFPEHAVPVFGVGSTINAFVVAWVLWRRSRAQPAEDARAGVARHPNDD